MLLSHGYQLFIRVLRQGYLASNVHDEVAVQLECISLEREECLFSLLKKNPGEWG